MTKQSNNSSSNNVFGNFAQAFSTESWSNYLKQSSEAWSHIATGFQNSVKQTTESTSRSVTAVSDYWSQLNTAGNFESNRVATNVLFLNLFNERISLQVYGIYLDNILNYIQLV